ncbi:hypothetical protein CK203_071882 [Vitis vinifera]|uniref:Uncharacterized protein n=1 Tax=Vitis vinifera TaxID=29760 RepID=A0A438F578_VITVI|nr:hypothetical protein CK203_071882 [Vitis vinifera]
MRLALLEGKIEKSLYKLLAATRDVGHLLAFYSTNSPSDLAKSHRLPFERSTSRAIKQFGLIHVDLWGATPIVSVNGARYFLLLVDDFSIFSWLYLWKLKMKLYLCSNVFKPWLKDSLILKFNVMGER